MTIEIKQADREALAASFERHRHQEIANWVRSMFDDESTHRPAFYALTTQRSTYEARIAELERERDAHHDRAIKARGQRNKAWTDLKGNYILDSRNGTG